MPIAPKKLIEVALPLEEINAASAREKSIRHGHPSTLHLWWARRPLAAARAVIFSQMVDDPSGYVEELRQDAELLRTANRELKDRLKVWRDKKETFDKASAAGLKVADPGPEPTLDSVLVERERERLFRLIRQLVQWENTTNESVLEPAREEIRKSWQRTCRREGWAENTPLPAFHDPFAGGGALPLEAQRLGMESYASDLNPVAVLINKAMIEIPPKFAGRPPVNPDSRQGQLGTKTWKGAQGLAEDVRYYGKWMRDEAEKRIGHLYPKIEITAEMAQERPDLKPLVGQKLTVIAWLWARTVKSPNPAFSHVDVPLASTFMLSTKAGKEAWVEPIIEDGGYHFTVKAGKPKDAEAATAGTKLGGRGANFGCLMSGALIAADYIRLEAKGGRMGARLMAIVAEGERGKVYLSPTPEHESTAHKATADWKPDIEFFQKALGFRIGNYGMTKWSDLFTPRQLLALTTFSDLVAEVMERICRDGVAAGLPDDSKLLRDGGTEGAAYPQAVGLYLSFAIDRFADYWSSFGRWQNANQQLSNMFGRQAIPMVWDYPEANPFSRKGGSFDNLFDWTIQSIPNIGLWTAGFSSQADAGAQTISVMKVVSTDPPYYDNIGYADLSDFFYAWVRRAMRGVFPDLFGTLTTPKAEELVATPDRHGGKENAESFFLGGMTRAMQRLAEQTHPNFPVSIYYAFKQSESDSERGTASTGWETFLEAVISAGFTTTGTWPMSTEMAQRMRGVAANALATSIVLVCRQREADSPTATRREYVAALHRELPEALRHLQAGNLAPVDLPQSAIGPGMGIFTRYSKVIEADGSAMSVRSALQLINAAIDEFLSAQESQMDDWTRFAVTWFSQHGYQQGPFGNAQNLATARNISVDGVRDAGILESGAGKVRLYRPSELDAAWDPSSDARLTIWEIVHQMIRLLAAEGEGSAAKVLSKVGALAEDARSLCYRLYTICEQKKWADEARDYNTLIVAWPELTRLAADQSKPVKETQGDLGV